MTMETGSRPCVQAQNIRNPPPQRVLCAGVGRGLRDNVKRHAASCELRRHGDSIKPTLVIPAVKDCYRTIGEHNTFRIRGYRGNRARLPGLPRRKSKGGMKNDQQRLKDQSLSTPKPHQRLR
jgi:hypothetical protein